MQSNLSQLDWQNSCSAYLLDGDLSNPALTKGLSIYKNSIAAIHHNALELSFPVLKELLGARIFGYVVNDYLKEKRWQSPSLDELGDDLSCFVEQHPQLSSMPYLREVVAIEWIAQSLAEFSESSPDLGRLLNSLLTTGDDIEIQTKPYVGFIQSRQGGIEIWMAHKTGINEEINLDGVEPSYWYLLKTADGVSTNATTLDLYHIGRSMKDGRSMLHLCQQEGIETALESLKVLLSKQLISFHATECK